MLKLGKASLKRTFGFMIVKKSWKRWGLVVVNDNTEKQLNREGKKRYRVVGHW